MAKWKTHKRIELKTSRGATVTVALISPPDTEARFVSINKNYRGVAFEAEMSQLVIDAINKVLGVE